MDVQEARNILAAYKRDKEGLRRQRTYEGEWTSLDERALEALKFAIDYLDEEIARYCNLP